MKHLLIILLLLPALSFGQGIHNGYSKLYPHGYGVLDSNECGLWVDSNVWFKFLATSDTNKVLGIDAYGKITIRTKGNGSGGGADSSIFATLYVLDTVKANLYSDLAGKQPSGTYLVPGDTTNKWVPIGDSVDVTGYATNYKLQDYKLNTDSTAQYGYVTHYQDDTGKARITAAIPTNNNQLINGAGYISGNQLITISGQANGTGTTSIPVTLDTANIPHTWLKTQNFAKSINIGRTLGQVTIDTTADGAAEVIFRNRQTGQVIGKFVSSAGSFSMFIYGLTQSRYAQVGGSSTTPDFVCTDSTNTGTLKPDNIGFTNGVKNGFLFQPKNPAASFADTLSASGGTGLTDNDTVGGSGRGIVATSHSGGGTGTVTTVTANALSPLFTASVANPTTTPSISYSLSSAAAYTVLCNTTNASAAPVYSKIDAANMLFGIAGTTNGGTGTTVQTSVNTTPITFGSDNTVTASANTLTTTTLNPLVVNSSLAKVATITTGTWTATPIADAYISSATNWNTAYTNRIGSFTVTGSSGAATFTPGGALNIPTYTAAGLGALAATTTSVNTVSIASGVNNTVPAAAGTLTGATLNSTVTASSLTSVGTLASLTMGGTLACGSNSITITGSLASTGARCLKGWFTDLDVTNTITGSISGNAATVTTNANLTGDVTSVGNATTIGALKVATGMIQANAVTLAKMDASTATARKALLSQSSASPIWSTETWAVPGTAGNVMTSDGTNWANTVAYNSANSASTIVQRDANNNCFSNDFSIDLTSLATAASTTTLTVSSDADYRITGSTAGKIIKLPATNTFLTTGKIYTFKNLSSVSVTFQSTDGTAFIQTLAAGYTAQFQCNAITNAAGTGEWDYYSGANTATYTFSTGLTNTAGTVTNDLVNGVDGTNIVTGTTTGIKIGTATTQKVGFFNSTPIAQPTGDVITALQNLGLGASLTLTSFVGAQVVTATGAGTYTPTAGAKSAYIWLVGSGGGGGGVKGATSSAGGGGGGGAGSVLQVRIAALSGTYSYTVGVHGTGGSGTTPSAGGNGGSSVLINGGTTYLAPGGTGGSPCTATSSAQIIAGGAGGTVATSGDVNGGGDNGKHGESLSGTLGYGGAGGSCLPYGSGGIELTATGATGNNAVGKGSGGSGGYRSTNANSAGGDGTDGILIIMEFK